MSNYKNGTFTRQAIVNACKKLFYEKGYRETSYADICAESHVDRSTVYYHFPSKEAMRLEVEWEYYIDCKHTAELYCSDEQYVPLVAMAIRNLQMQKDEKMRRFSLQNCEDYPVFTGKKDVTYFYYSAYEYMWGHFWNRTQISTLSFASVYGYIQSNIHMLCEHPDRYDALELNAHLYRTCLNIWGVPEKMSREITFQATQYISLLPSDIWKRPSFVASLNADQSKGATTP